MIFKVGVFLVSLTLLNVLAEASELKFEFKKGLLPNTYNLIVNNNDKKRTVEFYGCYNQTPFETNYYLMMKNGSKHYFDSKIFCEIGMKGRYWIVSGDQGKIPFKIGKKIIQNAEKITFQGFVFVPERTGGFVDSTDMHELVVTYDVKSGTTSFEIGKEILQQANFEKALGQDSAGEHPSRLSIDQMDSGFGHSKVIDEFRLKTKVQEQSQMESKYLEIAQNKIKEFGMDVQNMECRDKTTEWKNLLQRGNNEEQFSDLSQKLMVKDFIAINCGPKDINLLGGTISIFIDRETDEIIDVLRGQ